MTRLPFVCLIGIALAACGPAAAGTSVVPGSTAVAGTASVSTVEPVIVTEPPPGFTPPPASAPPTMTPIPTVPGGLGPTELKYRVLAEFPDFFFCDPDYYPVARGDEMELARQNFPDLQANEEEFNAILAHNDLAGQSSFSDEEKLLIYREHKKLAAVPFDLQEAGYRFQIQVAKTEGEGELVTGLIDGEGTITVQERTGSFATCPICLAVDTAIDTPNGPIPVQDLRVGMPVWTVDAAGIRVAQPVTRTSKTVTPASHQVIHLVLDDGRELWVSPRHPTADGRLVGQLQVGDPLDGAWVRSTERILYAGSATYDLLPAGDTGFYWADGILLLSTLSGD